MCRFAAACTVYRANHRRSNPTQRRPQLVSIRSIGHFLGSILKIVEFVWFFLSFVVVLFMSGTVAYFALLAAYYFWAPERYYSEIYNVPKNHVYIEAKPHDCEWEKAPIAKKYCHYNQQVSHDQNQVVVTWEKIDK